MQNPDDLTVNLDFDVNTVLLKESLQSSITVNK